MFTHLTCVVVDPSPANIQEMVRFLGGLGVQVQGEAATLEQLSALLQRGESPHVALVNLDPRPQEILPALATLVRQYPTVAFFVMSQVVDAGLLMDVIHSGAREFLPLPVQEEKLRQGLERIAAAMKPSRQACLINMVRTSGGCGCTTVACNVGASLAAAGKKVVIVDMDLTCGAVATSLDVRPRYTIADLMDLNQKLDRLALNNALAVHKPTGLAVLARPDRPEDAIRVTSQGLGRLLAMLGQMYDYIVIDSPMGMDALHQLVLRAADLTVLVMQLNVPSARNTERILAALRRMEIDPNKIRVVVNRHVRKGGELEVSEVERALGVRVTWLLPNDFRNAMAAINYGEPLVLRSPRAELSASLVKLAGALNGKKH